MGMDLYGRKPSSSKGEYFRLTASGWTPVWSYVTKLCPDLLTKADILRGFCNDGHKISAVKAAGIAQRLREHLLGTAALKPLSSASLAAINQGGALNSKAKRLRERKVARIASSEQKLKPDMRKTLMKFADFCAASGGFEID